MKSKIGFAVGLGTGIMLMLIISFLRSTSKDESFKYVVLSEDFKIQNTGYLRKGTILKIDQAMSEGFTRYVLYVNLKGNFTDNYKTNHEDEIIPYWLSKADSVPLK